MINMIEHTMDTRKGSFQIAFVLQSFVDVFLAKERFGVNDLLVKQVFIFKLRSKKSMLLLIFGKLEIMSLIAFLAGDGQNFFIF